MSRNVTLADMKTRVRSLADVIGDPNVTEVQLNALVNAHVCAVYDRLVDSGPSDRYAAVTNVSVTNGVADYGLPADFRNLLGVYVASNGGLRALTAISAGARARFKAPSANYDITLEYVPTPPTLSADSDTFDGVSGWEDLVVSMTARDVMVSRQDDPSIVLATIASLEQRITTRARGRDRGSPKRVVNLDHDLQSDPFGWGSRTSRLEAYRLVGDNLQVFESFWNTP